MCVHAERNTALDRLTSSIPGSHVGNVHIISDLEYWNRRLFGIFTLHCTLPFAFEALKYQLVGSRSEL